MPPISFKFRAASYNRLDNDLLYHLTKNSLNHENVRNKNVRTTTTDLPFPSHPSFYIPERLSRSRQDRLRSTAEATLRRGTIRPREDFAFQARVIDRRAGSRGVAGALQ